MSSRTLSSSHPVTMLFQEHYDGIMAQKRNIKLKLRDDDDDSVVTMDENTIKQVLNNLLAHAVEQ